MAQFQWARLQTDTKCTLRRGAWYRIVKLTSTDAVVDVKGQPVTVPRGVVQLSITPGARWTVVPRPRDALRVPATWGPKYAVCPNCRDRAPLKGNPASIRCSRCNGLFEVAWNEPYLTVSRER